MGSCYSCRSNGGPPTYSTVAMANTDAKDKRKAAPYPRGGGTSSFGFKRRIPATMKSHSQERTGELVSKYETKIATLGNSDSGTGTFIAVASGRKLSSSSSVTSNVSSTLSTNLLRMACTNGGAKRASAGGPNRDSICNGDSLENVNCADNNCNDIVMANSLAPTKQIPSNKVNSLLGSPKRLAGRTGRPAGRENSPGHRTGVLNDDARNGNDKQAIGGSQDSVASKASSTRLPQKLKTTFSGLPRPQVPVYISRTNAARELKNPPGDWKAETQALMTVEPMQISSDAIPIDDAAAYDGDSGIGTSVSDRRNDGDTETLAEVDQIEGDSVSLSSITREPPPEKLDVDNVEKQHKKEENLQKKSAEGMPKPVRQSGIARLKTVFPSKMVQPKPRQGSPVLAEKANKVTAPIASQLQQPKPLRKKQPPAGESTKLAVLKSSPKRRVDPKGVKDVKKVDVSSSNLRNRGPADSLRKDFGGSNEEWKVIAETRQKENITPDVEEVEIKPITLCLQKQAPAVAESRMERKSPKIEATLPQNVFEKRDVPCKAAEGTRKTASYGQAESYEENHLSDMGPYSPPSEKDFFLIDDEIADQPALIACQALDTPSFRRLRVQSTNLAEMNEEGGFPALAHTPLSVEIPRRAMAYSMDTMSPCSSLGSDDLMMDFERTDDSQLDCRHNRAPSDILEDGGQCDFEKDVGLYHLSKQRGQEKSPTAGGIFEEWSQMMESNHADGPTPGQNANSVQKYRSTRQEGNLSPNNATPINAGGRLELNGTSHSTPNKISAAASGSSYLARRSIASSLRPVKPTSGPEADGGGANVDPATYQAMCQEVTGFKTMLLRLKRVLQEADTLNPFEASTWKNGLFLNLASSDPPDGVTVGRTLESDSSNAAVAEIEQENADLRRQVVFFQQQIEERDRTIKLLQQQMAKYSSSNLYPERKEMSNAACQTERQKSLMGSSLSSSSEESTFGSTVSFRIGKVCGF